MALDIQKITAALRKVSDVGAAYLKAPGDPNALRLAMGEALVTLADGEAADSDDLEARSKAIDDREAELNARAAKAGTQESARGDKRASDSRPLAYDRYVSGHTVQAIFETPRADHKQGRAIDTTLDDIFTAAPFGDG
jgi:hypothetical protein